MFSGLFKIFFLLLAHLLHCLVFLRRNLMVRSFVGMKSTSFFWLFYFHSIEHCTYRFIYWTVVVFLIAECTHFPNHDENKRRNFRPSDSVTWTAMCLGLSGGELAVLDRGFLLCSGETVNASQNSMEMTVFLDQSLLLTLSQIEFQTLTE